MSQPQPTLQVPQELQPGAGSPPGAGPVDCGWGVGSGAGCWQGPLPHQPSSAGLAWGPPQAPPLACLPRATVTTSGGTLALLSMVQVASPGY